jgi:hypothetical protein
MDDATANASCWSLVGYPTAFALNLSIEIPWLFVIAVLTRLPRRRVMQCGLVANVTSHPAFWFGILPPLQRSLGQINGIVVGEIAVFLYEAVLFTVALRTETTAVPQAEPNAAPGQKPALSPPTSTDAVMLSLSANLASIGIGLGLQYAGWVHF